MGKTLSKIKQVEYSELVTLVLLLKDKRLLNIFQDELKLPINTLITLAKNDGLNSSTKETLYSIFEEVISIDSTILSKYETLLNEFKDNSAELVDAVTDSEPVGNSVKEEKTAEIVAEIEPVVESKPEKKKVNRKLPRRMGKEAIEKMITQNGGKSNQLQRVMLRINDLKNIYAKLQSRGIKEIHTGDGSVLSDDECRTISSAITILEQKIADILKK